MMNLKANTQNNTLLQATQANARPKLTREYYFLLPNKNFKFFSPTLNEKIKTPDTQATTMQSVNKINFTVDRHYTARTDRRAAGNSGFKKLAVQWLNQVRFSNQTLVQGDSFVLRNRQLLKPAKRYNVQSGLLKTQNQICVGLDPLAY